VAADISGTGGLGGWEICFFGVGGFGGEVGDGEVGDGAVGDGAGVAVDDMEVVRVSTVRVAPFSI
jgi:hypothetical protein